MGRIKTQLVKRVTLDVMEHYADAVSDDFNQNKILVQKVTDVQSKKIRDVIAGYATRLKKSTRY